MRSLESRRLWNVALSLEHVGAALGALRHLRTASQARVEPTILSQQTRRRCLKLGPLCNLEIPKRSRAPTSKFKTKAAAAARLNAALRCLALYLVPAVHVGVRPFLSALRTQARHCTRSEMCPTRDSCIAANCINIRSPRPRGRVMWEAPSHPAPWQFLG